MHEEHCRQQSGIHTGGQAVGLHPRLPVEWSQSVASLGAASCATGGLGVLADPLLAWIPAKGNSWEMATIRQVRPSARRTTTALVSVGLALSVFGRPAAPTPGPRRRRRPLRPAITGALVINGTRAGPPSRTGTGITATTGNAREARLLPRASDPGALRRRGHRRSHLHRRGHPG